jgi:alpha-N-arabinofuranosidase
VNWQLIGYGLHRPEQLVLPEGLRDIKGIYAVTIRFHDGIFYLITTCVSCNGNFYLTAEDPAGPWSDPVWLDAPGIDPSLFWDDDGRCYYVGNSKVIEAAKQWRGQRCIYAQEIDLEEGKMVGDRVQLTLGHARNAVWPEGPHVYKINGKYLLLHAEGGTGSNHSTIVQFSDTIVGPYTPHGINPVLTHRHLGKDFPFHSIGHTDLVQTQNGEWWAVMLGKRFVNGYTILGRETFLCPVSFEDEVPVFNPGKGMIPFKGKRPDLPWTPFPGKSVRDNFDSSELGLEWNMLRTPETKWYRLENGKLLIELRPNVLTNLTNPSLLARRIEHHKFTARVKLDFSSTKKNEKAGMIIYRNNEANYQFLREVDDLVITKTLYGEVSEVGRAKITGKTVIMQAESDNLDLQFSYGNSEEEMKLIGDAQNMNVMADELGARFNGPYVGMYATSAGKDSKSVAAFDWFDYQGK